MIMAYPGSISSQPAENLKKGFPALMLEVVAMAEDPATSASRLGHIIASDHDLSTRVLRIANSSALGVHRRVSDVSYAITLLGLDTLRDIMLRIMVGNAFRKMFNVLVSYEEFWNHAISSALIAQHLARKTGQCVPEEAFIAALFHDVGLLISHPESEHNFPLASNLSAKGHESVGGWLATEWHLGPHIIDAIEHHHEPAGARVNPALVATVHISDVLCSQLGFGAFAGDRATSFDQNALNVLGMRAEDLDAAHLTDEIGKWKADREAAPTFHAMVSQLRKTFLEAVSALPVKERGTLALFFHEGLSFADIARVLRVSEDQAHRLHESGVGTLVKTVQEHLEHWSPPCQ